MNWKTNYWTLLFAAAALVLIYQNFVANGANTNAAPNNSPIEWVACPTNSIPNDIGQARANLYRQKWADRQPISLTDTICNKDVRMFLLRKCELQQMLLYTGAKDSVYAVLGMNPSNPKFIGSKDTIDLLFQVFSNTNTSKYYDFSNPCPPMCGNGGGIGHN